MRIARTLLIALVALLVAPALPAAPALAQTVPPERVLRMVPNADLQTLDPINTTAGVVSSHAHMIYDQLFGRDENQRPQPQMVAAWSVLDDALTWRFTLREGLLFHDGAPVTAEDVAASLRRWGAVEDVANLICFLASDQAAYITGALIEVSGGKFATQMPWIAHRT